MKETTDKINGCRNCPDKECDCDKVEQSEQRFCSYCGEEMLRELRGAEENMCYHPDYGDLSFADAYNVETGKRQYCRYYKCSQFKKKKWFHIYSPHDEYFIDKVITN